MTSVLLVLSGSLEDARRILADARTRWPDAEVTAVLRAPQRDACKDLLAGVSVLDDKPAGGRLAFVRALRRRTFDAGTVAWTGSHSHWPSKLAFVLARVRSRAVVTERGSFTWSLANIARHLLWRAKDPVHASAGMPAGVPWPLALPLAALRASVGRVLGPGVTLVRALARRCAG